MIEVYLRVFINYKKNNMEKLLLMVKFAYNNTKILNTEYISFEFNCKYYLYNSYKNYINRSSRTKLVDKLATKFENLMAIYRNNLRYI